MLRNINHSSNCAAFWKMKTEYVRDGLRFRYICRSCRPSNSKAAQSGSRQPTATAHPSTSSTATRFDVLFTEDAVDTDEPIPSHSQAPTLSTFTASPISQNFTNTTQHPVKGRQAKNRKDTSATKRNLPNKGTRIATSQLSPKLQVNVPSLMPVDQSALRNQKNETLEGFHFGTHPTPVINVVPGTFTIPKVFQLHVPHELPTAVAASSTSKPPELPVSQTNGTVQTDSINTAAMTSDTDPPKDNLVPQAQTLLNDTSCLEDQVTAAPSTQSTRKPASRSAKDGVTSSTTSGLRIQTNIPNFSLPASFSFNVAHELPKAVLDSRPPKPPDTLES